MKGLFFYDCVVNTLNMNIQSKITEPVNKNGIILTYGASNGGNINNPISTLEEMTGLKRGASQNNGGTPVINNGQISNGLRRNRVNAHHTTIVKGQKWSIMSNGVIPDRIKLCIGWEIMDQRCEVDASAFMLCQNEKVPSDQWFVFYGQDMSPDSSVRYKSNKGNDNLPDDAEIIIDLNRVRADIQKISVCATIYESMEQNLNFGMVKNVYTRVLDDSNNELCYMPIVDYSDEVKSLVIGEVYRYKNLWKFCVVSAGYKRDLAQLCNIYGVELE